MILKLGKFKGQSVADVLKTPGGDKVLAGHLDFIKKGFDDPKWGGANKKYYSDVKKAWDDAVNNTQTSTQPSAQTKPSPMDAIDELRKKLVAIDSKIEDMKTLLTAIKSKVDSAPSVAVDVKEWASKPEDIKWDE